MVAGIVPGAGELMMHRFWGLSDAQAAMMQQIMFMKTLV